MFGYGPMGAGDEERGIDFDRKLEYKNGIWRYVALGDLPAILSDNRDSIIGRVDLNREYDYFYFRRGNDNFHSSVYELNLAVNGVEAIHDKILRDQKLSTLTGGWGVREHNKLHIELRYIAELELRLDKELGQYRSSIE